MRSFALFAVTKSASEPVDVLLICAFLKVQ